MDRLQDTLLQSAANQQRSTLRHCEIMLKGYAGPLTSRHRMDCPSFPSRLEEAVAWPRTDATLVAAF